MSAIHTEIDRLTADNDRLTQALAHIGRELGSFHRLDARPTKDELWGLYSCAISALGSLNQKGTTLKEEKTPSD